MEESRTLESIAIELLSSIGCQEPTGQVNWSLVGDLCSDPQLQADQPELHSALRLAQTIQLRNSKETKVLLTNFSSEFPDSSQLEYFRALADKKARDERLISIRQLAAQSPEECSFITCDRLGQDFGLYGTDRHPSGMFRIKNGIVIGAHAVLLLESGMILREQNVGSTAFESLKFQLTGPSVSLVPIEVEEMVSLVSPCTYCFYHWMLDSLPKALIAELCGYKGHYLVPGNCPWAIESLGLFEITPDRIIFMNANTYGVKNLYVPTHWSGCRFESSPELVRIFREKFLQNAPKLNVDIGEKIYVARKSNCLSRRVVNEPEVEQVLGEFGFAKVYLEEFSLLQQVALMKNARVLVGPHGSGMVHSLFIQKQSTVVEFFSLDYVNYCYLTIMDVFGHRHHTIFPAKDGEYKHGSDILVPVSRLRHVLKQQIS